MIRQKHTASVVQGQLRTQGKVHQQTRLHIYVKIDTYTLDRFFKFGEIGAIHGEDTGVNLRHVSRVISGTSSGLTIAFMGLNPGKGSTGLSAQQTVSPMKATEHTLILELKDTIYYNPKAYLPQSSSCYKRHTYAPS